MQEVRFLPSHQYQFWAVSSLLKVIGDGCPETLLKRLLTLAQEDQRLNIGCVAAHGYFQYDDKKTNYEMHNEATAATAFLFALISRLQFSGTVPMIDINAYGKWLLKD